MRTIILAAGKGTRLKHLTENKPKCLVEIFGRPLIYYQVETFKSLDINKITIVGGYYGNCLKDIGTNLIINERYYDTNMVYSLFCAKSDMDENEDLIVSYGDIIFEPKILEKLINSKADISVIIDKKWINLWNKRMDNPLEDAETLKLSKNNHIIEIGKKTDNYKDIQGQYIGLFKIAGNKIEAIKKEWEMMDKNQIYDGQKLQNIYMTSFLQHLISKGWNIKAVISENGWLEVDTEKDLKIYEAMEKENTLKQLYEIPKHFKI